MSTERDAFVGSLANFTGIHKVTDNENLLRRELTDKNIKCAQAMLHLARYEGNYLGESWTNILKIMSMINYYHALGSGSKGYAELFMEEKSNDSRNDPEIENIKYQNAAHILSAIEESEIDKIFENSINLGADAIGHMTTSMCKVSSEELKKGEGPRIFLLQKLVEVVNLNMNRVRMEFKGMWKAASTHFSNIGSHPNENVAMYAVDFLRQLANKYLEKEELKNYNYQKAFLEPFRMIMLHNLHKREGIKHLILSCMCLFAKTRISTIRSGWEIIIEIFKLAGEDDNIDLAKESLDAMEFILRPPNFPYVEEYFDKIIDCLFKFVENVFEDQSLMALKLVKQVSVTLGENDEFIEKVIERRTETNTKQDKESTKKDLWNTILLSLAKRSFEKRRHIAEESHNLMFLLLSKYNGKLSPKLWEMVFRGLIKAIFEDLNVKIESKDVTQEGYTLHLENSKLIIDDLIQVMGKMDDDKFIQSTKILLEIFKNFTLTYVNSPLGLKMIQGMNDLISTNGCKFTKELWKEFIQVT